MTTIKVSMAAAVAVAMTLLVPAAAQASVGKSGTKNCTANQTGVSRAYSTGTTEHYPPDTGYGVFYNGSTWKVTAKNATSGGGGFWFVETNGSIGNSGTYAYCINGTP
ncbi:hypothetical protein GCM10012283_22160 [Phycicoccus endophyticus]|nr:hypothetical protein GCM10012283_22160 [Phycicoccus endophyticus]